MLSCNRSLNEPPVLPVVTTPADSSGIVVDNKWECELDGVPYYGTIDTSFTRLLFSSSPPDTIIECTGTSNDKRANIHFRILLNRKVTSDNIFITAKPTSYLIFDTSSTHLFEAHINTGVAQIKYNIDTITSNKLKVSFTGSARDNNLGIHTISKGKFSCEFNKWKVLLSRKKLFTTG